MSEGYDDTSSDVKKRTSPREKASTLAKQLYISQIHKAMTPEEKAAMDQFFKSDPSELEEMIQLYLNIILFKEKDEIYQSNQSANGYILDINTICNYLIEQSSRDPKYKGYSEEIDRFMEMFLSKTAAFISNQPVENYSIFGGYELVQKLLKILSRSMSSYKYIKQLETLEDKLESIDRTINSNIREELIRSFIYEKRTVGVLGDLSDSETNYYLQRCEGYFLKYALKKIQSGNIDTIWEDEVLNVVLQLRESQSIEALGSNRKTFIELEKEIEKFVKANLSQVEIKQAKDILEKTIEKYKDKPFTDVQEQKDFLNAYKQVYLSELLGKNQRDHSAISPDCALFILRQMQHFTKNSVETQVYSNTLMKRTAQEIIVKENIKQLLNLKVIKDKKHDKLVVLNHPNQQFHHSGGSSFSRLRIINVCTENLFGKDSAMYIIETAYHELDHQDRDRESRSVGIHDYIGYKCAKSKLLWDYGESISIANYYNMYHEISAFLAGNAAKIRTYKQYPAGETPEKIEENIDRIVDVELKFIEDAMGTSFKTQDSNTEQWVEQSDIQAYDDIVLQRNKYINYTLWRMLRFEYNEDGTPKTLEQIIQDQEDDLQSEYNPNFDTTTKEENAKIRFQIMIERAMYTGEEEKCIRLINKFVMDHQELFEKDHILGQNYNPDTIKEDLKTRKREVLKEGTPEGIQDAIFIHILGNMIERISQKHKFTDEMFDFLFRMQTGKDTEKNNLEAKKQNPSHEQTQPQDGPEGQDQI